METNGEDQQFQDIVDSLRLELDDGELDYTTILADERHNAYVRELARMVLADSEGNIKPGLIEEFLGRVSAWGKNPEEADVVVASQIITTTGNIMRAVGSREV